MINMINDMIKKSIFGSVLKLPTQMGTMTVVNASSKFSHLSNFN
jgi:hypothetical protein